MGRFSTQNLEHDSAAGRTTAFDRLSPVFHRLFDRIGNLFFGLTLYAVSFSHNLYNEIGAPYASDSLRITYKLVIHSVNIENL